MKILIEWLSDVYAKNGYMAVLAVIVVLVVLALGVSYVTDINVADIARWVGGIGG